MTYARQLWCAILLLSSAVSAPLHASNESPATLIREGQWVEVRGTYSAGGQFTAQRIDLVQPSRYEILIGTIHGRLDNGMYLLMDQPVEIQVKTEVDRLDPELLDGVRVKIEGYYRGENKFSAREISPRGAGRNRVTGRVDRVRKASGATELSVMNYTIVVPESLQVRHEQALGSYSVSDSRVLAIVDRGRDEEDLFGEGTRLTDNLVLSGQIQARASLEDEFDLRKRDPEDRQDSELSVRGRLIYQPSEQFFALFEMSFSSLWRDDDEDGRINQRNTRIGEAYVYWMDPFSNGLDFQLGRIDYDEKREWLYDQNLDGPRLIWQGDLVRAELSVSTTLSDGSPIDEEANNGVIYVSNLDDDRHIAAYLIHRDFSFPTDQQRTHLGVRAHGEWLPDQDSWLEVSYMQGEAGPTDSRGWGFDLGTTWHAHDRFAFTIGYALGTGNDPASSTDETFRQTGLQDNNDKFAGVTSFRYYGELADPELANLEIQTLGLTWLPRKGVSVDVVGHRYRQNELNRRLVNIEIDKRPNGRDSDLGWEIDLVIGWRTNKNWDLEAIAGWFSPGKAFDEADSAFLAKLQLRYRL